MKVVLDNTFLTLILNPSAVPRPNPQTQKPTPHCRQRIDTLIDDISVQNGTLYVPTPSLAEALCAGDNVENYVAEIQSFSCIELAPFDGAAAYELGQILRKAKSNGDKRSGQTGAWQHVKMDRLIVAIAIAKGADLFLSDDSNQIKFAMDAGLNVKSTWDLPISPERAQQHLSEGDTQPWPERQRLPNQNGSEKPQRE